MLAFPKHIFKQPYIFGLWINFHRGKPTVISFTVLLTVYLYAIINWLLDESLGGKLLSLGKDESWEWERDEGISKGIMASSFIMIISLTRNFVSNVWLLWTLAAAASAVFPVSEVYGRKQPSKFLVWFSLLPDGSLSVCWCHLTGCHTVCRMQCFSAEQSSLPSLLSRGITGVSYHVGWGLSRSGPKRSIFEVHSFCLFQTCVCEENILTSYKT